MVAFKRPEPIPAAVATPSMLSAGELEFIRRSARAQQDEAHQTLLVAHEMSSANEEMRARILIMESRIAAQAARRKRPPTPNS